MLAFRIAIAFKKPVSIFGYIVKYRRYYHSCLSPYKVNYDNASLQLLEENKSLNYKLYYQHGLKNENECIEYDKYNDKIWYGLQGKEVVLKLVNDSKGAKYCDSFIMRDYHNHQLIGWCGIKRTQSNISQILHLDDNNNNNIFNYVIRRNLTVKESMQNKGYGKILRKYSKELEDLHIDNYGISITGIQTKNVPSMNLNLKSDFRVITEGDAINFVRNDFKLNEKDYIFETICFDENKEEWDKIQTLYQQQLKDKNIIDFSLNTHEIYKDKPLYVIKDKLNKNVLAVLQCKQFITAIKPPGIQKYAMNIMAKFMKGMARSEEHMNMTQMWPIYIDYDNKNIAEAVYDIITFCIVKNDTSLVYVADSKHPFNQFINQNESILGGFLGKMMSEQKTMKLLMKIVGLNEIQINTIQTNPIILGLPVNLL